MSVPIYKCGYVHVCMSINKLEFDRKEMRVGVVDYKWNKL